MQAANSAGVVGGESAPCSTRACRSSGFASIRRREAPSRSTMGAGVPAGAASPSPPTLSKPGIPASAVVGTFGSAAMRRGAVTPSARTCSSIAGGRGCWAWRATSAASSATSSAPLWPWQPAAAGWWTMMRSAGSPMTRPRSRRRPKMFWEGDQTFKPALDHQAMAQLGPMEACAMKGRKNAGRRVRAAAAPPEACPPGAVPRGRSAMTAVSQGPARKRAASARHRRARRCPEARIRLQTSRNPARAHPAPGRCRPPPARPPAQPRRIAPDGAKDAIMRAAAAEVAVQGRARRRLVRVGVLVQQRGGADQDAGEAIATLPRLFLQKGSLQRVRGGARAEALHRPHPAPATASSDRVQEGTATLSSWTMQAP